MGQTQLAQPSRIFGSLRFFRVLQNVDPGSAIDLPDGMTHASDQGETTGGAVGARHYSRHLSDLSEYRLLIEALQTVEANHGLQLFDVLNTTLGITQQGR